MEREDLEQLTAVVKDLPKALGEVRKDRKTKEPLFETYLKLKKGGYWKGKYNVGSLTVLVELASNYKNNNLGDLNGKN